MTSSALAERSQHTNKKSSRRGNTPKKLIIHHTAGGSNAFSVGYLADNPKKVSAHYVLETTGRLNAQVEEENRAWTTGWEADKDGITVETVNSSGAPEWRVTDDQLEMLAALAADLSDRYDWGELNRTNVTCHLDFKATACPGPYIFPRMDSIIARANEILSGSTPPAPEPEESNLPDPSNVLAYLDAIVNNIIRGEYGNGEERVRKLTEMGFSRQDRVNLQAEVTRRMNPKLPVEEIATQVIRGDWGNGTARAIALKKAGDNYHEVQAEVRRQLTS